MLRWDYCLAFLSMGVFLWRAELLGRIHLGKKLDQYMYLARDLGKKSSKEISERNLGKKSRKEIGPRRSENLIQVFGKRFWKGNKKAMRWTLRHILEGNTNYMDERLIENIGTIEQAS